MTLRSVTLLALAGLSFTPTAFAQRGGPPPLPDPLRREAYPEQPRAAGLFEVQTRGPVHEAFLGPAGTPDQPLTVPQPPPAALEEAPPEQRPHDDGVVWVSGYWAWDDQQARHVWVSGCWRVPPPGKVWLPGRWQQVRQSYQWVPGAWLSAEEEQVPLLPPPPPPRQEEPPPLAPGQVHVPGSWVFRGTSYAWREGFALDQPHGWVWVNARYVRTPAGCVFVEGHWDLPLHDRGLLFAPVTTRTPVPANARIEYVPQHVIDVNALLGSLFVNARNGHYYFGDYFDARQRQAGYTPWHRHQVQDAAPNPLYSYYRRHSDRQWVESLQSSYEARYAGRAPRPPQSYGQQEEWLERYAARRPGISVAIDQVPIVSPLPYYGRHGGQLKTVTSDHRSLYQQSARRYAEAAHKFQRYESEYLSRGHRVQTAPVPVPLGSWHHGHPHGLPPGQARKYATPYIPAPRYRDRDDDDDDDRRGGKKPKRKKDDD